MAAIFAGGFLLVEKKVLAITRETERVTVRRVEEKEGCNSSVCVRYRERERERGAARGQRSGELEAGGVFLLAT